MSVTVFVFTKGVFRMERQSTIHRRTAETDITVSLDLDGSGIYTVQTGIPFLDHMLSMVARHGFFDLDVSATGDLDVDYHHTVEDVGICLGQAFHQAMGSKQGLRRYASASVPLEETLASVVVDFCDRPYLVYNVDALPGRIGSFDVELVETFFLGICQPQPRHAALQPALRPQPPPRRRSRVQSLQSRRR